MFSWSSIESYAKYSSRRCALVLGIGGGGDIIGAIHIYLWLKRLGVRTFLASIPWERFSIDPTPGPIAISEITNYRAIGNYAAIISGNSCAYRYCGYVEFQAACVARQLGTDVIVIDGTRGSEGIYRGLLDVVRELNVDLVVGVDVGGDVLATSSDFRSLWSPLMDSLALAALSKLSSHVDVVLAVHGMAADGELPMERILERLSEIASLNGIVQIHGLSRFDIKILDKVLERCHTEASRVPVEVFKGVRGVDLIREQTRVVNRSILQAITVLLEPKVVYETSDIPRAVNNTHDTWEANAKLHKLGLYTELDLELDLFRIAGCCAPRITYEDVMRVRNDGLRRYSIQRHI